MKIKTSELSGAALDWVVAGLEGEDVWRESRNIYVRDDGDSVSHYSPSTYWAQGGQIIEREKIILCLKGNDWWSGGVKVGQVPVRIGWWKGAEDRWETEGGPTPLIAAMRCYVASKLGNEVEVPDELLQGESK